MNEKKKKKKREKEKDRPHESLFPNKMDDPLHQWLGEEAWERLKRKNAVFFSFGFEYFQNSYYCPLILFYTAKKKEYFGEKII